MNVAVAEAGHNNPPAYDEDEVEQLKAKAHEFADAAGDFLDLKEIDSDDDAQRANDFIAGARKVKKTINDARIAAKKPHDAAAKAVQDAYSPLTSIVERSAQKIGDMLTDYMSRKRVAKAAEDKRLADESARAQREAKEASERAARQNDVAGEVEAEAMQKRADEAEKVAARAAKTGVKVASASGGARSAGLREIRSAEITNIRVLFVHYQDHPKVAECLRTLANADIRARDVDESLIPGIKILAQGKAV